MLLFFFPHQEYRGTHGKGKPRESVCRFYELRRSQRRGIISRIVCNVRKQKEGRAKVEYVCLSSKGIIRRVRLVFWESGELRFACRWRIVGHAGG